MSSPDHPQSGPSRREKQLLAVALVVYAAVTLTVALHHEAWRDEGDPWLLMRDGGIRVMLSETAYAGTPALWYLLLAPLAASGLPFVAQQLLNLLLIWCGMAVFLFAAPFHPALKVLFLFSFYPVSEYALKARPYSLVIVLLFLTVALWMSRDERPLLLALSAALLANATAHGLLIAAAFGAVFLLDAARRGTWRNRRTQIAVAVMLTGGILSALQLRLPGGWPVVHRYIDRSTIPWAVGTAFFPEGDPRITFAGGLLILLIGVLAIGDRMEALLFLTIAIVELLLLFQYVWVGGLRHTGLILMVCVAGIWMAAREHLPDGWRRKAFLAFEIVLALALAGSIPMAARESIDDMRWQYSGGKEMAEYIRDHVPASTVIAAPSAIPAEAVLTYLPGRRAWYALTGDFGSYFQWDALGVVPGRKREVTAAETIAKARVRFAGRPWLLLVPNELSAPEKDHFRLVYTNRERVCGRPPEYFWLYAPQ